MKLKGLCFKEVVIFKDFCTEITAKINVGGNIGFGAIYKSGGGGGGDLVLGNSDGCFPQFYSGWLEVIEEYRLLVEK